MSPQIILEAITRSDTAIGFTLDISGRAVEPVESVTLNPDAKGLDAAIRFNNGMRVLSGILVAAEAGGDGTITIPGLVKFRLYRKEQVFVGANTEALARRLGDAASGFLGAGGQSENEIETFKAGAAAALSAATTLSSQAISEAISKAMAVPAFLRKKPAKKARDIGLIAD